MQTTLSPRNSNNNSALPLPQQQQNQNQQNQENQPPPQDNNNKKNNNNNACSFTISPPKHTKINKVPPRAAARMKEQEEKKKKAQQEQEQHQNTADPVATTNANTYRPTTAATTTTTTTSRIRRQLPGENNNNNIRNQNLNDLPPPQSNQGFVPLAPAPVTSLDAAFLHETQQQQQQAMSIIMNNSSNSSNNNFPSTSPASPSSHLGANLPPSHPGESESARRHIRTFHEFVNSNNNNNNNVNNNVNNNINGGFGRLAFSPQERNAAASPFMQNQQQQQQQQQNETLSSTARKRRQEELFPRPNFQRLDTNQDKRQFLMQNVLQRHRDQLNNNNNLRLTDFQKFVNWLKHYWNEFVIIWSRWKFWYDTVMFPNYVEPVLRNPTTTVFIIGMTVLFGAIFLRIVEHYVAAYKFRQYILGYRKTKY